MARSVKVLQIFLASPSDVQAEREQARKVVEQLNIELGPKLSLRLEIIGWESHTYSSSGADPQALINEQLAQEYDIFVGIMWHRFGSPTPRAGSGTEEEFSRAIQRADQNPNRVKIMFFFKEAPVSLIEIDPDQLKNVREFRTNLGPLGVFYKTFSGADQFPDLLRMNLSLQVHDYGKGWGEAPDENLSRIQIDSRSTGGIEPDVTHMHQKIDIEELGIFELFETFSVSMDGATQSMNRLGDRSATIGAAITKRTASLTEQMKDTNPASRRMAKRSIDRLALDLESMEKQIRAETPILSANLATGLKSFADAASMFGDFDLSESPEFEKLPLQIKAARENLAQFISLLGDMEISVGQIPRITSQMIIARNGLIRAIIELRTVLAESVDTMAAIESVIADSIRRIGKD